MEKVKNEAELLALAEAKGFSAALLPVEEIPVNAEFRKYCEENRCGRYNANYSCPPACGTPEQLHQRLLAQRTALVLKTEWEIGSYANVEGIIHGKTEHNTRALALLDELRAAGYEGIYAGSSCCGLCAECKCVTGEPCPYPERRYSCVSAYCVDVAALAARCGLPFAWDQQKLYCYSLIAFRPAEKG